MRKIYKIVSSHLDILQVKRDTNPVVPGQLGEGLLKLVDVVLGFSDMAAYASLFLHVSDYCFHPFSGPAVASQRNASVSASI